MALILGAAKQSTSRSGETEISERLEANNANRVVKSPDQSLDFVANIPATLENATRLVLYRLWHANMRHVNLKRLGSLFQYVTGLERVNLLSVKRLNYAKCNFSNIT